MILCCGEALIDMIPTPTTTGTDGFVPHSGGAVFNTSIALGRQGGAVGMVTGLSSDMFGVQLAGALDASGVDRAHIVTSDRPTTLAFVKLTDGHAEYSFFDENSAGRMLTPADMPALPDDVGALFFGGISLACEPCADAYAALLAREHGEKVVMIDPNIRPTFIADKDRFLTRMRSMIALADIVKVSDEDLDWIIAEEMPLADKVAALLAQGPSLIILTRGSEGATGYLKDGSSVSVSATKVEVVDTVGAGDTYNAGFLAKLSELGVLTKDQIAALPHDILTQALEHGGRTAAITVSRAGANAPWAHEL
jgi:fructokinase